MARTNVNFDTKKIEILKIALGLFMEKGYENTTIEHIYKSCNISKGAMYHYFKSKEEILEDGLKYLIDLDFKRFENIINDPTVSAIEKIIYISTGGEQKPDDVQKVYEQPQKNKNSIFDYRAKELSKQKTVTILAEIIKQGIKEGTFHTDYPDEMADFCFSASLSIYEGASFNKSESDVRKKIEAYILLLELCLGISKGGLSILKETLMKQVSIIK